jgi:hypothetical protein
VGLLLLRAAAGINGSIVPRDRASLFLGVSNPTRGCVHRPHQLSKQARFGPSRRFEHRRNKSRTRFCCNHFACLGLFRTRGVLTGCDPIRAPRNYHPAKTQAPIRSLRAHARRYQRPMTTGLVNFSSPPHPFLGCVGPTPTHEHRQMSELGDLVRSSSQAAPR